MKGAGKEFIGQMGSLFSTTLTSVLTTSITTVMAGGDVHDALINSGKALLVTALPQLISSAMSVFAPRLITILMSTIAGPITLAIAGITAAVLGGIWLYKNKSLLEAKKLKKQTEKEYEEAKEKYTKISEMANEEADRAKE
jgi:flagellar biosynthesis component FlhA